MMMDVSKQMGDKCPSTRCYTDNISAGIDWLEKDIGVKFGKIQPDAVSASGPHLPASLGEGLTGGARLVPTLRAAAKKRGIEVLYEHKADRASSTTTISCRDGREGRHSDEGFRTGMAFEGRRLHRRRAASRPTPKWWSRYIGGWATRMVLRGSRVHDGRKTSRSRMPLYAKFVNMDQFHCGPIVGATHVNPADVLNSGYGVQVEHLRQALHGRKQHRT